MGDIRFFFYAFKRNPSIAICTYLLSFYLLLRLLKPVGIAGYLIISIIFGTILSFAINKFFDSKYFHDTKYGAAIRVVLTYLPFVALGICVALFFGLDTVFAVLTGNYDQEAKLESSLLLVYPDFRMIIAAFVTCIAAGISSSLDLPFSDSALKVSYLTIILVILSVTKIGTIISGVILGFAAVNA